MSISRSSSRRMAKPALVCAALAAVFAGGVVVGVTVWPGKERKDRPAAPDADTVAWRRFLATPQRPVRPEHRAIPPGEDEKLLEGVLHEIFPDGWEDLTAEAKAIEILRYSASSMRLKSNSGSVTKLIRDGYSLSGGMNLTFRVLCRLAGMATKYGGMMNLPGVGSHAVSEVHYDGQWHFFDAAYGIFLYSKGRYDRTGHIVSFHDILTHRCDWTAFQVVAAPWSGTYDAAARAFGVRKCATDYLRPQYGMGLAELYRRHIDVAFPVAYDRDDVVSFPVEADLRERQGRSFGEIDASGGDVQGDSLLAGSHYLGGFGLKAFHTWLIRTPDDLGPQVVHITYRYHGPMAQPPELRLVPFRSVKRKAVRRKGKTVTFDLIVSDAEAIAAVFCPRGVFLVDAMQIHRDSPPSRPRRPHVEPKGEADVIWRQFATSPQPPVKAAHRTLRSDEDEAFLQGVLAKIFPKGHRGLTGEQKCIEIMRYVTSSLKPKSNIGTATKILKDGYASCGGMSLAFRTLCQAADMPAKYVAMWNLPGLLGSHAISEVFYEGGWHFYDPSFGFFFYSRPRYDKAGRVVSFHDLMIRPKGWALFQVVGKPWTGKYDDGVRAFGVRRCSADYLEDHYGEPLPQLYRRSMRVTFPIAYDHTDLLSFPVDADLRKQTSRWYGKIDASGADVELALGYDYVGGAELKGFHTWTIRAPAASEVRIVYHYHGRPGSKPPELRLVPLRALRRKSFHREGKTVTFDLAVSDKESVAVVFCPRGRFLVDAIQITRD